MMKSLVSTLILVGLSSGAFAANSCGTSQMFERGTNTQWQAAQSKAMLCNYSDQWLLTTALDPYAQFKFDRDNTWNPAANWGEVYPADGIANLNAGNILVNNANSGTFGIQFNAVTKAYAVGECKGVGYTVNQTGSATRYPLRCGANGKQHMDLYFGANTTANPDLSNPFPTGNASYEIRKPLGNGTDVVVRTLTQAQTGIYRFEIDGQNQYSYSTQSMGCGLPQLKAEYPSQTGQLQSYNLTCGADNKWHLLLDGQPHGIRFVNGSTYYGDTNLDQKLDLNGNLIYSSYGHVEVIVDWFSKSYFFSGTRSCGGSQLKAEYPNQTGKLQTVNLSCNGEKWQLNVGAAIPRVRLFDANLPDNFYGDSNLDGVLELNGALIETSNKSKILVDFSNRTYSLQ